MSDEMLVVADSHIGSEAGEVTAFVDFLMRRGAGAGTVAHLGDLFNIWIGQPRFEMPHMKPVLEAFRALRRRGVRTILVEGNRDLHSKTHYEGDAFTSVSEDVIDVTVGGRRVRMSHGDRVNVHDRQYQTWRAFAKSRFTRAALEVLPSSAGVRMANALEARMRTTNLRNKIHFPVEAAAVFAERAWASGADLLLLGHFHEERVVASPGGTMVVLPDWRASRRYVAVGGDGGWRFETWAGPEEGTA